MTLQIALVGTDGTVIASDKKVRRVGNGPRTTCEVSKFCFDDSRRTVALWAGTGFSTIAERLLREEQRDDRQLQKTITEAVEEARTRLDGVTPDGEVILLSVENPKRIRYFKSGLPDPIFPQDKIFAGDSSNPAVSLVELFYGKGLSTKELIPLTAHAICTASRVNPDGIGELEIWICTSEGFRSVPETKISELTRWSKDLDERIGDMVKTLTIS